MTTTDKIPGISPKQTAFLLLDQHEALYGGSVGGGKACQILEEIPTPNGMVPIRDLHAGDPVFGSDGTVQIVLAESEIMEKESHRLTFDDGSSVVVANDHLWKTFDNKELAQLTRSSAGWRAARRAKRPSRALENPSKGKLQQATVTKQNKARTYEYLPTPTGTVRTTQEIVDTLTVLDGRTNHAIPVAGELNLPERDLPVDPYTLGAWLGDGMSASGCICGMDGAVFENVELCYAGSITEERTTKTGPTFYVKNYLSLKDDLQALGLIGGKRIPDEYLWASATQRLALLQGLMDTDGNVSRASVEFTNTNQNLTEGVAHLARSLGMKVWVREGRATLYGKDCGPKWGVKFAPNRIVFRIPRKANSQSIASRRTTRFRYITDAQSVGIQQVKCIKVSSPDSLFLITEHFIPTHNSEALLLGATQYVDDYPTSALLLRKTYRDLDKPGGLMFRAREWFTKTDAHWDGINFRWIFPSGATINFGYLDHVGDEFKFQSSNYDSISFDELTHFPLQQYLYMFSRLRKLKDSPVPLRMRGGTNPGGCVPYGDVMTPNGWIPIQNLSVGDAIFTVEPDGELTETVVARTYVLPWNEPLINVKARGLSMTVTADHRVAKVGGTKLNQGVAFSLVEFQNLPGQATILRTVSWTGERIDTFTPEPVECNTRLNQPTSLSGDLYMQLLGWVLSEGHTVMRDNRFGISQMKPQHRITIEKLLDDCGFSYRTNDIGFYVTSPEWSTHFSKFGLCRDKYIHDEARNASTDQLDLLLNAMMAGDGHWVSQTGGEYYTTSKQLADDFAEIALKVGYIVYVKARDRENRVGLIYGVSIKKKKSGGTELLTGNHLYDVDTETKRRSNISETEFNGTVYCIGVDRTETFVIRQGGPVWVSGNSGHGWVRKRFNLPQGPSPGSSRAFIQAGLYDNPFLEHENYLKNLDQLGAVTKAQLVQGDWLATSTGGYFQAEKFRIVGWEELPHASEFVAIIRYWDFAATAPSELNPDPDYTVGLKIGMTATGSTDPTLSDFYVLDVERFRGDPGAVEARVRATALRDGPKVVQWLEQERGAAGKLNFRNYAVNVLQNSVARPLYAVGKKEDKAKVAAARVSEGRVFLVDGPWIGDFIPEMAVFPLGSHDDQVDGLSNGIIAIDRERIFASQGEVQKASQDYEIVRRRNQRTPRSHVGY